MNVLGSAVVEGKREVPWTKPEDIPYDADKPLPKLGGWFEQGFCAAFCDGQAMFIASDIDEKALRAWITRAGGENVSRGVFPKTEPASPRGR